MRATFSSTQLNNPNKIPLKSPSSAAKRYAGKKKRIAIGDLVVTATTTEITKRKSTPLMRPADPAAPSRAAPFQQSRDTPRSINNFSRPRPGMVALIDHDRAIHQNIIDALWILLGIVIGGAICHPIGIEKNHIGPIAFL